MRMLVLVAFCLLSATNKCEEMGNVNVSQWEWSHAKSSADAIAQKTKVMPKNG